MLVAPGIRDTDFISLIAGAIGDLSPHGGTVSRVSISEMQILSARRFNRENCAKRIRRNAPSHLLHNCIQDDVD